MTDRTGGLFVPALEEMTDKNTHYYGPVSFRDYLRKSGASTARKTPEVISIDALSKLQSDLREAGVMVFRLGIPSGTRFAQFGLARATNGWSDCFFVDDSVFAGVEPAVFIPNVDARQMFAFEALPELSESSLVALAGASGLLGTALGLDTDAGATLPARGQGVFSFEFRPNTASDAPVWLHDTGQVEIDALFVGRRAGREQVFVIESRVGAQHRSLAKHKLLYSALAVSLKLPDFVPIVPVYLRILKQGHSVHFLTCECSQLGRTVPPAITEMPTLHFKGVQFSGE